MLLQSSAVAIGSEIFARIVISFYGVSIKCIVVIIDCDIFQGRRNKDVSVSKCLRHWLIGARCS